MVTVAALGLSKRYGSKVALDNFNLVCSSGSIVAIVGPNGSGKSTALSLMTGLIRGEGRTLFDGQSLASLSYPAEMVGAHLRAKAFHPRRTAENHLRMVASGAGVPQSAVNDVLRNVGLYDVRHRYPKTFSLGMAQRLSLACTILAQPKILFLDEPLNGLDINSSDWLAWYLTDFAAQGGVVVISSHLMEYLDKIVNQIVVIVEGRTVRSDTMIGLKNELGHYVVRVTCEPARLLAEELVARGMRLRMLSGDTMEVDKGDMRAIGWFARSVGVAIYGMSQVESSLADMLLYLFRSAQSSPSIQNRAVKARAGTLK